MRDKGFTPEFADRMVRSLQGHLAFIPPPLPPQVTWTAELAAAQSAADSALGRLSGMGQHWARRHLLTRAFTMREAVLSSRIEGTEAEISDLVLFQVDQERKPRVEDVREVHNYVVAVEHGLAELQRRPLTLNLLKEMHALLMKNVRGHDKHPGEFRRVQAWIARPGQTIEQARFVPPPPEHLQECLDDLEKYLHAPSDLPPLVRIAILHYQFEAIHPFTDGNGRLGRMLITLLLSMAGALPQPILYLSDYLERHRQAYYDHLLEVSRAGRWTQWIIFFLRGISEKAASAAEKGERLLKLREEFRHTVQMEGASSRILELIDHLFASPMIQVADAERVMHVTRRAAQSSVDKLVALGLLREITGRSRDRIFEAPAIMRLIEDDEQRQPPSQHR